MARSITNVAASVRQRLLNLSQVKQADYNALLTQYAVERFLYRLSKSALADRFVLKGAMLFRVWAADLHRPTKDVDLLGFGEDTPDAVAAAVRTIMTTQVPDDGMTFNPASTLAAKIRDEQEYGGIRAKFGAKLGNARIALQVDVGFGDSVTPQPTIEAFPTLLDQDAPRLRMYPPETVVAEKFEVIASLGMTNSRMKDYYDLLAIFRIYDLDTRVLAQAIAATFRRRRTSIPEGRPTGLSAEFVRDSVAMRRWAEFLRRLRIEDAPIELREVVETIWARLETAAAEARRVT